MMVLLGYFLIAAIAGVAASAIIGFVLTNLLIGRFEKADRPIRISSNRRQQTAHSNQFSAPSGFEKTP
jgi:hypothetical protein